MSSRYAVRQVEMQSHADAIASLWTRCLQAPTVPLAHERLNHRYLRNPAGAGAALVLECGTAEVAGVQCLHLRRFHQGPQVWTVAGLADYAVAQAHRTLGPALQLMKHSLAVGARAHAWIYGFANARSEAVCKRGGLRLLGHVERLTRPLRTRALLQRWLPGPLAAAAAPLADAMLWLRDGLRRPRGWHWRDDPPFDAALDAIWAARPADLALSERSRAVLAWRFGGDANCRLSVAIDDAGRPLGYVVWRADAGLAEVLDFLCVDPARATTALLLAFAWHVRARPVERVSVEFFGSPQIRDAIAAAGYIPRAAAQPLYVADGLRPPPAAAQWYLTSFDRDGR